jgi:hypothetical protein
LKPRSSTSFASAVGATLEVIKNPSEADLLANWKRILFENNRGKDRLNEVPLTDGEMQQIMEQITALRTPLKLNGFINGKTVAITRDNPADTLHFGKEVSLKVLRPPRDRRWDRAATRSRSSHAMHAAHRCSTTDAVTCCCSSTACR